MEAFATAVLDRADARLILAGPAVRAVADDPTAAAVYREVEQRWQRLPRAERDRIDLVRLSMRDHPENAAIVNALQREASVIVKKSLAEGFGLGVTEAMGKRRPVVASRVGGHREARQLAKELEGTAADGGGAEGGAAGDPLSGDVVVLAVWYDSAQSVVEQYGDQLDGKVVVDVTNPVDVESFDGLVTPPNSSAAEELARKAPEGAQVVKAFNTTFAGTLAEGRVAGQPLDVLVAGDEDEAKQTVTELARAGGLNPIDAGPLRRARELERLGFLHMALQDKLGTGFGSAVKLIA